MATVHLRRGRAKPFFFGHPWVFSGSVAKVTGKPADGDIVTVLDERGTFVAKGFYNGRSQIRVRLATWDAEEAIDAAFFHRRLQHAVALRERVLGLPADTDAYRLVYSEADGLPGLIVDRYADWLAVQVNALGIARRKGIIVEALARLCPGKAIFERTDTDVCGKEGIEPTVGALVGPEPPDTITATIHGVRLHVDLRHGQKTGLFLDHRTNYTAALPYLRGRRVLDCFCHTGAFAIFAKAQGQATEVTAIDLSDDALAMASRNAELNGVPDIAFVQGNVFGELRRLRAEEQTFGAVILDPPRFARSAADLDKALRGYKDINLIAMQCLEPGGILITSSCSQHVDVPTFTNMLNDAACDVGREVQILERRGQAPDHPIAAACPESAYLKCFICRIL